jgi:hypothetical protein
MKHMTDKRTMSQLLVDGLLTERAPAPKAPLFKAGCAVLSKAELEDMISAALDAEVKAA